MKLSTLSGMVAAMTLASAPIALEAKSVDRLVAPTEEASEVEGGSGIIVAILAAAAVIGGIIIAADGSENTPTSP